MASVTFVCYTLAMNLDYPKDTQIFVIEGIAGAGKNTLHKELVSELSDKIVYDFPEEDLLNGWKHVWIPNITQMRITLMNNILDYCSEVLEQHKNAVFIFQRFHLSCVILDFNKTDVENNPEYIKVLDRLRQFKTHVFLPVLDESDIEHRSAHKERLAEIWQIHLQKRLQQKGVQNLTDLYKVEQKAYLDLIQKQNLPHSTVRVEINPTA